MENKIENKMESETPIKVYIVAGGDSVGKTCAIRHICGLKLNKVDIEDIYSLKLNNGTTINTYCNSKSLQEAGIQPIDVQKHVNNIAKTAGKTYSAVIVALRTDKYKNMPEAIDYMNAFVGFGWQIEKVIELVGCLRKHCRKKQYPYQSFQPIPTKKQVSNNVKTFFGF